MSFYSLVEILYYLFTCRYNNRTKEEGSKASSFFIEQRITIEIFFLVEDNYRDANIIWYANCARSLCWRTKLWFAFVEREERRH